MIAKQGEIICGFCWTE